MCIRDSLWIGVVKFYTTSVAYPRAHRDQAQARFFLSDDQDRTVRPMQHPFAHAPEDQSADLPKAPAPHDDEVSFVFLGRLDDLARGVSSTVDAADTDVNAGEHLRCLFKNRLAGPSHPVLQRPKIDEPLAGAAHRDRRNVADIDKDHFSLPQLADEARSQLRRPARVRRTIGRYENPHHLRNYLPLIHVRTQTNLTGSVPRSASGGQPIFRC